MSLTVRDGGGGASKPTTKPTTNGDSHDATKAHGSRPSLTADDVLRPDTGRRGRGPGLSVTAFLSAPAAGATASPTIAAAVRDRAKPGASTPTTKPERAKPGASAPTSSPKPSVEQEVASESEDRRGRETENDGRADGSLRSGSHSGGRDTKIRELKEQQAKLAVEETKIEAKIEDIEEEIETTEGRADTVGTVVDVMTSPVTAIAGLFGRSNPISNVAEGAVESLMGLNEDKDRLEETEKSLEAQQKEIAAQIEKLEEERTLNFLADVAYVTSMPDPIADVLEGAGRVDIKVVDATGLGSDAAYSSDDESVIVDQEVIDKVNKNLEALQKQGIVDEDGRIIDAAAFDASKEGDSAISTAALIGVHEITHGAQDQVGLIESAAKRGAAIIEQAEGVAAQVGGSAGAALVDEALVEAEMIRIDMLEYDAYVNQETLELQSGKEKQGFVTINPDGSLLPRDQAVENIYQFQLELPLLHGVSQGKQFSGVVTAADDETPGRRMPGEDTPGRRMPGSDTPGRRMPGEDTPGRRMPGSDTPGRRMPGNETL